MTELHHARRRSDLAAELGEHGLRAALRSGALKQLWPGVIVPGLRALELPTRAAAALLFAGEGAVLSGPTAAQLYGCTAATGTDVHVTVPYSRWVRRRPGLVVHHDRFAEEDVGTVLGMPVLALDFVIAELLCTAPKRLALACADQAVALAGAEEGWDFLGAVQDRLVYRDDRRGTLRAAVLLGLATGKAESPPESWLRLLVADAGYPLPEPQYEVRDLDGRVVYRLDLAWPELRIALEYDGYEAHEHRESQDAERDARLRARGWMVIRARAEDMRDSARLLGELAKAFGVRRYAA
ncbi:MAG TPA: DUF559 domain-containing protein [Actinophytocola sp.]|uniref:DUF559 domain-containing protein n=1 Tax=Actinophytocola sp. TaxID=1872138 RepID=UPI002DDDAD6A|nr:DUF559 domain-containing protein [Actinophytocola sp.]HEV2783886.1 DUF559 domain-containing protein [Actinophytocola sp.]